MFLLGTFPYFAPLVKCLICLTFPAKLQIHKQAAFVEINGFEPFFLKKPS